MQGVAHEVYFKILVKITKEMFTTEIYILATSIQRMLMLAYSSMFGRVDLNLYAIGLSIEEYAV